jgi:hypothetical protein
VYAHLEEDWRPEVEVRMAAYLDANPQGRHGTHRYAVADVAPIAAELEERLAGYLERFAVPAEHPG